MRITPLEIRQKTFEKKMRGYDKEAVDTYTSTLSHEWERLLDENKNITDQLENSRKEVTKLREVEEQLFKTLKTAEETGNNLVEQANKSAELTMKEAQMNAEAMLVEAKAQVNDMLDRADEHVRHVLGSLNDEVKKIEADIRLTENNRDAVIREIKNLANDALDKVDKMNVQPVKVALPKIEIEKPTHNFDTNKSLNQSKEDVSTQESIKKAIINLDDEDNHHSDKLKKDTIQEPVLTEDKESTEFNFEVNTNFDENNGDNNLKPDKENNESKGKSFFDLLED